MDERRALQKNAASDKQSRRALRVERRRQQFENLITLAVMSTVEGRAFCRMRLERAKVFESIWSQSAAIHYNAGRQDYGHELIAELTATPELEQLYLTMEAEARARLRKENADSDAAEQQNATEENEQ